MGGMKLAELEFVLLLPEFMQDDEAAIGLSKAMDKLLGEPSKRIPTIRTWDQIDNLTAAECDEMAWELDVDWYDDTLGIEEKRATIKAALQIKRKRGTKWAVEQLITAYLGDGYVAEWFEVDGEPYTFLVLTTNPDMQQADFDKFVAGAKSAKNTRSHIAGVSYLWQQGAEAIETSFAAADVEYDFVQAGTYPIPATIGMLFDHTVEADPDAAFTRYEIGQAGVDQCGTFPGVATLGALLMHKAATAPVLSLASYDFVRCGTMHCGE